MTDAIQKARRQNNKCPCDSVIQVEAELGGQGLQLWTRHEWRQSGVFNTRTRGVRLRHLVEAARDHGFAGIRFVIEMTWALDPAMTARRLKHWEAAVNHLVASRFPTRMVCQYNRLRLSPVALQAALRTHPQVILGRRIYPSLFYEAPLITEHKSEQDKLNWMLAYLEQARAAQEAQTALIRQQQELSERRRIQETQQFLAEASAVLASSLDYPTTLATMARLAVPRLADWCIVNMLDEKGELQELEMAHQTPVEGKPSGDLLQHYPLDMNALAGAQQVIHTGQTALFPEITEDQLTAAKIKGLVFHTNSKLNSSCLFLKRPMLPR